MQRISGVSLAFDPLTQEPVIAFLGGDAGVPGWEQSDVVLARRSKLSSTWSSRAVATDSAPPMCHPIDQGSLVGLSSTLAFDSTGGLYYAFRDGHNGQFPIQDWASSDVEVLSGRGEASLARQCLTGDHRQAYGGHLQLAIGVNDQPALIYDQKFGGDDVSGQNVFFQRRTPSGVWTTVGVVATISDTMTGAALAAGPTGYSVAVTDRHTSTLLYFESSTGDSWPVPDPVWGSGTGGWYPSVALDPVYVNEPSIAFYVCSPRSGIAETSCLRSEDSLQVTARIAGVWRETLVDPAGGWAPKLGFLPNGKRVIVYRVPAAKDPSGW